MPLYEYQCDCGATLEILDRVGSERTQCGEECSKQKSDPSYGKGALMRQYSAGQIRGDSRQASEPNFDPCKRSGRPVGCD